MPNYAGVCTNEKRCVVEWIMKGANTLGWSNVPATNKYMELKVVSVMEVANNLITNNRDYWDWNTLYRVVNEDK